MKKDTTVELMKKFMKDHDLTQYRLAGILGCPHPTLSRWLLGKAVPSPAWRELIIQKIELENNKITIDR